MEGRLTSAGYLPAAEAADSRHTTDATPGPTQGPAAATPALDPEIELARAVARAHRARPPREAATSAVRPLPGPAAQVHG